MTRVTISNVEGKTVLRVDGPEGDWMEVELSLEDLARISRDAMTEFFRHYLELILVPIRFVDKGEPTS